jgi:YD repeat-containing protein
MLKSGVLLVCLLGLLACGLTSTANAQVGNNCISWPSCGQYSLWNAGCVPAMPVNIFNCAYFAYTFSCEAMNANCFPIAAPAEIPHCNCGGGYPIEFASGDTYIEENDVNLPGLGGGLTLRRTWNSVWPATQTAFQIGMFGPNWRSTYEEQIFVGADNYVKYARGDGNFWSFGYNNNGTYLAVAPSNVTAILTPGTSYWTLAFQNGEQRLFDNNSGKLIAIIDRNGNETQLSYDSVGRLVTVTDPASRHLYFTYGTGSGSVVTAVTSDFGVSLSYSYDTQGRLVQYTKPDQTTISFQYNSNSLISAVVDQNGKVLEAHTYDSRGRGLTSTRSNGVDAISISYTN